jgi:hypothetical protein
MEMDMNTQTRTLPRLDPHLIYAADALVSAVMGVALIVAAEPLTQLAGWPLPAGFLVTLGLLLLPWAVFNGVVARMARPARAVINGNIAVDAAWVLGSIALGVLHADTLTAIGMVMLAGQAIAVAGVFAIKLAGARELA